jgi:hypothetical protein
MTMRIQNVYGDFLRSFKVFLDRITRNSLNKIELNYGAKTLEYYYMMNGHEQFEYPVALLDIQDIQPVDGVSAIARNPRLNPNFSPHNTEIAHNNDLNQTILLDKRWVNLLFTVTINTEDVASLLNYHDLFMGALPLNFMFYDYSYYSYLEITELIQGWDYNNESIENVFLMYDSTYKYDPGVQYKESNEDFFASGTRDRIQGDDLDDVLEGQRYFSMVKFQPIIKLTGIQKQTDKEQNMHSLTLNFEARMEIPNLLMWHQKYNFESVELVIDTVSRNHQEYPILSDIPENFLTNKNIVRGILLSSDNFVFPDTDPVEQPYLTIPGTISSLEVASLWAVEDVTETSASRFFIPLKHATIQEITTPSGTETRFYFQEMEWLRNFDFSNPYNYLKMAFFQN